MRAKFRASLGCSTALLLLAPGAARPQPTVPAGLVDQAQKQVVDYVGKLADLHCTEDVVQEKLRANGSVEVSARNQYDYFLLMQGNSYDFQLTESRLEMGNTKAKHVPLLLTNGFSTLLLVFHPYYRAGFEFAVGSPEEMEGRSVVPVRFSHISGARSPVAMAMRGREFPLDLQGTAWIDPASAEVVRMDAGLEREMTDVGLRTLRIRVDFTPSPAGTNRLMLPSKAVVDLETPKQHWKNTHVFHNYKLFSTDATQDPDVKVHAKPPDPDPSATPSTSSPNIKEQP